VLNGALDVPEGQALAYAILVHAALYFPITLLGVIEWSRQQLSVRQLRGQDDEDKDSVEPAGDTPRSAPPAPAPRLSPDRT
jgi:hypothetical protein